MDINKILDSLELDLSNPEVRRGAIEAIDAILSSRISPADMDGGMSGGGMSGDSQEIELDPDLLQPSIKHGPEASDDDIEVEDEDNVLDSIKHNESDEPYDDNTSGNEDANENGDETELDSDDAASDNSQDTNMTDSDTDEIDDTLEPSENSENSENSASGKDTSSDGDSEADGESGSASNRQDSSEESSSKESDPESADDAESGTEASEKSEDSNEDDEEDEEEFDETDFLDDDMKGVYDDKEATAKQEARRIKRERTILAAKRALDAARARNTHPSLIRELEKSLEALEELQEAVKKSLKDMSDEEFDLVINRVLDAIDAVGNSELTVKTAQEKELQAKEIKQDLGSAKTQNELSAEDTAKIRAEVQAVKAREKEKDKYKQRSASSFKGFRDFLNSLYRAVAMQVKVNEVQDDSWSALSRRNSGVGVLKQGKKINELPDTKIPVIDFYFDCSGSWGPRDIQIGKKAVESLVEMEEKGQIKINLYYFGDRVATSPDSTGGGTSGWNEIVKNVIATQATNVIVMTDADMEDWWSGPEPLKYTVPGYVWYLWRDGINAPRLPRDLKGRGGTQQFSFSHSDL